MERHHGSVGILPIECINRDINKWRVRWDIQAETTKESSGVSFLEAEFLHHPSLNEVKDIVIAWYNNQIDDRIRSGFVWNTLPVWLSSENQFNYKAAYDLAVQTNGANLPITFKFGTTDEPHYKLFSALPELTDFYTKAMAYVNNVLSEGWKEKDAIDWTVYNLK